MENIIDLVYKLLFEIKDSESKLLYEQLIKTHPHYKYILDRPSESCTVWITLKDVLEMINFNPDNCYFPLTREHTSELSFRGWKEWIEILKLQYEHIIKTKS